MRIEIKSNKTYGSDDLKKAVNQANPALDKIWKTKWLNESILKSDLAMISDLSEYANKLIGRYEAVLIVAGRGERQSIKAITDLFDTKISHVEPVYMPLDFSTRNYAKIFKQLENKSVALIAVSINEEDLQFKCAYSIAKQFAFSQANRAKTSVDLCAIYGSGSTFLREDAKENEYMKLELSDGTSPLYLANTAAVLLPLMLMGVDAEAFLRGFSENISSPEWDLNLPLLASRMLASEDKGIVIESWQSEFVAIAKWFAQSDNIYNHETVMMPANAIDESAMHITLAGREALEDLMTPPFEGCDEDGSLQLLLNREREERFTKSSSEHFSVELVSVDAEDVGELVAFLQMTQSIEFLIKKEI